MDGLIEGMNGVPDHRGKGHSAQDRLDRMIAVADKETIPHERIMDSGP